MFVCANKNRVKFLYFIEKETADTGLFLVTSKPKNYFYFY